MKLIITLFTLAFFNCSTAQDHKFVGKIEYVKENKLLSGEYASKSNGESVTFFSESSYSFENKQTYDYEKLASLAVKSIPNEYANDSFEIARQKEKIKRQFETQLGNTNSPSTIINYKDHIAFKAKEISGTKYCIVDSLQKISWILIEDTLTIDGLLCQKASGMFIGRKFNVWFAPSIPFAAGPLNMHGLPGIIVLATSEDEKVRYRMKALTYPLATPIVKQSCNGGKQISNTDFMYLQANKRSEMKQQMEDYKKEKENGYK
jgi:GLPGLI family protein